MKFIIFLLIFVVLINLRWKSSHMTIYETLYFNYLLFLINNSGLIFLNKNGSYFLQYLTNDPLAIHNHRKLEKKYDDYVETYIITNQKNYYILKPKLAKEILNNSPLFFNAGLLKDNFFKQVMPNNLGIAKCDSLSSLQKCPWKKLRTFNDSIMGSKTLSLLPHHIQNVLENQIPLKIEDWKRIAFEITATIIYGDYKSHSLLEEFYEEYEKPGFLKSQWYQQYVQNIQSNKNSNSLINIMNDVANEMMKNSGQKMELQVFLDQIPHIFAPTIFMIHFLIPNLMSIILNFEDIKLRIKEEINKNDFDILSKNTFLHHCVIEHIRLFNTININIQRTSKFKQRLSNGLELEEGDQIFILFSSILRDEEIFKNPDTFEPNRWETNDDPEIVFGIGKQKCISVNYTPIIYKSIIYLLLKNHDMKIVSPKLESKTIYNINPYTIEFST